jgi:Spy/CpxP family protein refolding chaperone
MQTTRTGRVGIVLALSLMLCGTALAQGRGFGRGMGGGANLLRRPEVQAELKLTDDQKTKVTEMLDKLRQDQQGRFQDLRDASPEERQKIMAEMQAEQTKRVNAILNTDQQKRFREISLQQQGYSALAMPDVQTELKLTDDQKSKVREIMQQQQQAMRDIFQNAGGDREAARSKMEELRKANDDKLAAVLTDDQKNQWKAMLGTPFKLEPAPAGA